MATTPDDHRPVPTPFGWCAECIREGIWLRAATMHGGTAMCAQHTVYKAGPGDVDIPEERMPLGKTAAIVDELRRSVNARAHQAGF